VNAGDVADLADWRRRISELYAEIRRMPEPPLAWEHWRHTRDTLFKCHPQSAIEEDKRASFFGLNIYPYDPALRFLVTLATAEGAALNLPAGVDGTVQANPFARTNGLRDRLGGELTLYWLGGYGGGVLLPFTDATSGHETYGGGRYLLDTIKSADLGRTEDGRTILDFNFAYAPSCAHTPRYICPLAPQENRLPAPVRGGERS
jgi:uncharacterized protein (DUF1684 family)